MNSKTNAKRGICMLYIKITLNNLYLFFTRYYKTTVSKRFIDKNLFQDIRCFATVSEVLKK